MLQFSYRCSECDREYQITPDHMLCEACAKSRSADEPLRGVLEVSIEGSLNPDWKIADLLPVEERFFPSIPVGNTPLWAPSRLRSETGFDRLYLKDDTANPSGSLKDRASYLVAAFAAKHDIHRIVLASTGNAGSSMAAIGAAAGIEIKLYLPKNAPKAKLVQAAQYGANIIRVDGTYDLAYDQATEAANADEQCLSRNTGYNPLTIEGKKTVSLEIYRQLSAVPDYVFVPAGDGVILSGVYKGFEDLVAQGVTKTMPTVVAVQATGSSALARAYNANGFESPVSATTIADSISVDVPRGGYFALQRLKRHKGRVVTVTDEHILEAQHYLASRTGLFAEPAAAASVAGFKKLENQLSKDATVVLLVTGSGLKDIDAAMKGVGLDG